MDELKQRHAKMWASGDFPSIAPIVVPLSLHMVEALAIAPGQRVLDVGGGTGSASIPAARTGADVVATDLTPELLDVARAQADEEGLEMTFEVADAEALPYEDASFDVVMSSLGAMFAPHHEATASELLRVTKPGGKIGMANWTPEGQIGEMFRVMKPFAPPPPPGAQPAPLWGSEDHVRELLGPGCSDLQMTRHELLVTEYATARAAVDDFKEKYGPTIALLNFIGDDEARHKEFDDAYMEFTNGRNVGDEDAARFLYEYLLVIGTRA
jgi:SAM-dependent methyltransferase